jgi:lysophospholipase L1-like esterase
MQKNAGNSMWNDDKFYESLLSEPDYVIIMMGTNDAQLSNFDKKEFTDDYVDFVKEYQKL